MQATRVKVVSVEDCVNVRLEPAPNVVEVERIRQSLDGVPRIDHIGRESYPIRDEYRWATVYLAPNCSFYRCDPCRPGVNQWYAGPQVGDTETVQLRRDGKAYTCIVEYK